MTTPCYNTKEGIEASLSALTAFHEMLELRRSVKDKIKLNDFVILNGKIQLDQFAQCCPTKLLSDNTPIFISTLPLVLTKDAFHDHIEQYDIQQNALTHDEYHNLSYNDAKATNRLFPTSIMTTFGRAVAPAHVLCSYCGEGWNMTNATDFYAKSSTVERFNVDDYIY